MKRQPSRQLLVHVLAASTALLAVPAAAPAAEYGWNFTFGNLNAAVGNGILSYADAATPGLTTFGVTDGTLVPHIGGLPAAFMHVPAFTDKPNGYLLELVDTGPNGGGAYVNQFTIIFDVLSPGAANWTPFFNTEPGNGNDADWYATPGGALGIGALGYSANGVFQQDTWHRIAFAADLGAGNVSFYVDGVSVRDRAGASLLDGRFSLYSNADAGADLLLFNEGDTSGVYTHELYVASLAFVDRQLSAAELGALGGPKAEGILVPEPAAGGLLALGGALVFGLRRRRA